MRYDPTGMTQEQKDAMDAKWQEMQKKNLPTPKPPPRPVSIGDDFGPNYGPHPEAPPPEVAPPPQPQTGGHTPTPVGHGTISGPSIPGPDILDGFTPGGFPIPQTGGPTPYIPQTGGPRPFRPFPMSPIFPPPNPYQSQMGIGSLFNRLAYMPEEQFSRNLGRYQKFNDQYGGMLGPSMGRRDRFNLFNQLGGMSDEQFGMGMDRLSQYRNVFDPQPQTGTPQGQAMPPPQTADQMQSALNQDRLARQYYESPANPYYSPSYTGSFGQPRNPYFGGDFGGGIAGRGLYGGMGGGMGMGYGAFGGGGYYRPSAPPSGMGGKGGARNEPELNAYSGGGGGKGGGI